MEPDKVPNGSFTQDLEAIRRQATGEKITVAEIENILQGRGFATLSLILCVPFIQPIPVPGVSIVFGVAIMILGMRLVMGTATGLPRFVTKRELKTETLHKITEGASKLFSYVERLFKPRLGFMLAPPMLSLVGVSIVLSGLALSLPLPPVILFSNSLPAWAVILLCLGYLERDGFVIAAGHCVAFATWCYFAFWWEAVKFGFQTLISYFP